MSQARNPGMTRQIIVPWRLIIGAARRLSWGVADQGMSSVTNFVVNIYIARTLGAVQYGAFGLAFVTYSFALNASRGLATDPLLVRFSHRDIPTWRRAVANCTGASIAVGVAVGACVLAAAAVLPGPARMAFFALGLTMPGLLLQDSWRFSFFALGRGVHAFINDTLWAVVLLPALVVLHKTGHGDVFWAVFAWGASGTAGALIGAIQARVMPRLAGAREWVSQHRDLGPRYLIEGTANSGSTQLRNYGIGFVVGLAGVGYVQAAATLMGPFMVIFFGMGLVTLPEASRLMRRSLRHLTLFCVAVGAGLTLLGLAWGIALLIALPRGLGHLMLGTLWRPTYPLVLPSTLAILGWCASAGASTGLHALAAAKRSVRAMVIASGLYVVFGIAGALAAGAVGAMEGAAVATWIGAVVFWAQMRAALRDVAAIGILPAVGDIFSAAPPASSALPVQLASSASGLRPDGPHVPRHAATRQRRGSRGAPSGPAVPQAPPRSQAPPPSEAPPPSQAPALSHPQAPAPSQAPASSMAPVAPAGREDHGFQAGLTWTWPDGWRRPDPAQPPPGNP